MDSVVAFLLSLVVLLFVATVMSVLAKRVRLPLSVSLVAAGLLLGELIRRFPTLAPLGRLELTEDMVLYVFLPTIVFQAAFAAETRLILKNIVAVLGLAVPAVLISFGAVAYGLHWTLGPAALPLAAALLFGALITATDSSSVMTIFREIGAPKRLRVLVEGENLFNDAVSIVIFLLVAGIVGIRAAAVPEDANLFLYGAREFLLAFVGGLGTGVALGYFFGKLIEAVETDELIEILLTTVLAYLSFLVAELAVGASGITAVVAAGMMLGGWGRTKFTPGTLDYLNRFWAFLSFVVNSLVFLLTGLAIQYGIVAEMLGGIVIAFLVATAARALGIMGVFPLINALPGVEKTDVRYQAAIVWGGIRGGTALALALAVPETFPQRNLVVGLTVGVVVFSLFFQGLTLEPLIRMLGLHKVTPQEQYSRDEALHRVKHAARKRIPELRAGGVISESVAHDVSRMYAADEDAARQKLEDARRAALVDVAAEAKLLRRQMLLVEKRTYRALFHSGVISEKGFKDLQHSIDVQLDHLRVKGELPRWTIHSPIAWRIQKAIFRVIDVVMPTSRLTQRYRLTRIAERYEENWGRVLAASRVIEEIAAVAEAGTFDATTVEETRGLYRRWSDAAQKRLDLIGEQFPEYVAKVQEMVAIRLCLSTEDRMIVELGEVDALSERDVLELRQDVADRLRTLKQKPIEQLRPYPRELLAKVPFFRGLAPDDFEEIVELLQPRTFLADEQIVRQGDMGDSLFLIGRGVVRVSIARPGAGEETPIATLLAGDFFGEMAVLSATPRSATVTAATDCALYELRREDLETALEFSPTMRQALVAASDERRRELRETV